MTKLIKHAVATGAALMSSVVVANADSTLDTINNDKTMDNDRLDTWRKETKDAIEENAQAESAYRMEADKLDKAKTDAEREYQAEKEAVQKENEKRKLTYEKEKKEVDEANRAKRAKYHEDYAHYIRYKDRGATEPTVPTYEPLPTLELTLELLEEPKPLHLADGGSFNLARPVEKHLPHTPKLDFIDFLEPAEVSDEIVEDEAVGIEPEQPETNETVVEPKVDENPESVEPQGNEAPMIGEGEEALAMSDPESISVETNNEPELSGNDRLKRVAENINKLKSENEKRKKQNAEEPIKKQGEKALEKTSSNTGNDQAEPQEAASSNVDTSIKKEGEEALEKTSSNIGDQLPEKTSSNIDDQLADVKKQMGISDEKTSSNINDQLADVKKQMGISDEKTASKDDVDSDKLITVSWVNEQGHMIKPSATMGAKQSAHHEDISGYTYVTSKQEGDKMSHIYKKGEKPKETERKLPKTESTQEEYVKVYITDESAISRKYFYTEAAARAHNSTGGKIHASTEVDATDLGGFSWVGEEVEPNPQKEMWNDADERENTKSMSFSGKLTFEKADNDAEIKDDKGSDKNESLPHTGDSGTLASLLGAGLMGVGALGLKRRKKTDQ